MKRKLLSFFILLVSVGFASAAGLSDILNGIDEATIILFAVFIVSFSLLFFALNRVFKKENTTTSGIISIVISFLIVYGINKSGLNLEDALLSIGVSSETLGIIVPLIIVAGIIFLIIKLAKDSLIVVGGLFIVLSFFVYAKLVLVVIGCILIILRFTVFLKKGRWERPQKKGYNNMRAGI